MRRVDDRSRKTYSIEVHDRTAIQQIDEMLKYYVADGKNIVDAMIDYANQFNRKPKRARLVTESELLELSKQEGLTTGKSSIVQYRRKGVLKDKTGPWVFQNNEHRVVYDLDKMLTFLKERSLSPKSRLSRQPKKNTNANRSSKRRVSRKATTQQ
jgi:hypothetical protein